MNIYDEAEILLGQSFLDMPDLAAALVEHRDVLRRLLIASGGPAGMDRARARARAEELLARRPLAVPPYVRDLIDERDTVICDLLDVIATRGQT